jgi:hypothetical protein
MAKLASTIEYFRRRPPSRHTRGELRPVALGPASRLRRRHADAPAGAPQARLRRGPKLDGASRPPRRTGSFQPHFPMVEPSWPLWRCDDRNQGRLGAEGTYGAGRALQTRVRGKVSSSWKEVLRRASSPASWPGGRSANIHRMRSQSRTTPLPVPCYQSPCSIPSDAIFSILPARSSNE